MHLLLAEDNLPDVLLVREAIRKENLSLDVHVVADGEQAIEFIARADVDDSAPCPNIILIDLNLPRRDGFEVLRYVRDSRRCRNTPVLIVTSSDAPNDRQLAADLGASYFRKPPSYLEFLRLGATLKQILHRETRSD